MKAVYKGPTDHNIKHGQTYYIVIRSDKHTPAKDPHQGLYRQIAFVHTNSELGNCIGTRAYDASEWIQLNDRPGYKRIHVCPNCDNDTFYTTAVVTQNWLVDAEGNFIEEKTSCEQVVRQPDDAETWYCSKCHAEAKIGYVPVEVNDNEG